MGDGGILIAGAGIGGLAAALALARHGIAVTLFEQSERLEETGAGIQLAPNATRLLSGLDLASRLKPAIVAPVAVRLRVARSGRDIAVMPLAPLTERCGAPYWVIHRADLQAALREAACNSSLVTLRLGAKVEGIAVDDEGVRITIRRGAAPREHGGSVLIGADGLWSSLRRCLGDPSLPRFSGRAAWRALVPARELPAQFHAPEVTLWLGGSGHLVHYPIRGGAAVNIVAVARESRETATWSTAAAREDVLARFPSSHWAAEACELLATPELWQKWSLYDRPASWQPGRGRVTLLGDAAHPMLPFLAQGAAMAIEDAVALAGELANAPERPQQALRAYEAARQGRIARVLRASRRNDRLYHFGRPADTIRNAVLRRLGGEALLAQYDWIFRRGAEPPPKPRHAQ